MKKRLIIVCALLASGVAVSPSAGLDGDTGYGAPPSSSANYGPAGIFGDAHLSAIYFDGGSSDGVAVDLGGVVVLPFNNGWSAAFEADTGYLFGPDDWVASTAGHYFYTGQSWAAGGFFELTTEDVYAVGAEGAAFINNIDAVASFEFGFGTQEFMQAAQTLNFYVDPNTALSGGLEGAWFDGGGDAQAAFVGVEHRLADSPVSGFVDLGWDNFTGDDTYFALVGGRIVFGDSGFTLQEYNRANPF